MSIHQDLHLEFLHVKTCKFPFKLYKYFWHVSLSSIMHVASLIDRTTLAFKTKIELFTQRKNVLVLMTSDTEILEKKVPVHISWFF